MKTVVIFDKLFGGPQHGKVIALDPRQATVVFPALPRISTLYTVDTTPATVSYRVEAYTRRRMVCGRKEVLYYAHHSADEERGFEMLVNYMLRGAREI